VCTEQPYANVADIILDRQVVSIYTVYGIQTKPETGTCGEMQIAQHACEGLPDMLE
jgi:hypothetical protein